MKENKYDFLIEKAVEYSYSRNTVTYIFEISIYDGRHIYKFFNQNILYISVDIEDSCKETLFNIAHQKAKELGWNDYKVYCDHSTMCYYTMLDDDIINYALKNAGNKGNLLISCIGNTNKAIALKVETLMPCKSKVMHITLATNNNENGKPVDSNSISEWNELEKRFFVKGRINIHYKNSK